MDELAEITDYIQEMAGDEAEVIFGHGVDPDLGESIRVTVITTGFDNKEHRTRINSEKNPRIYDLDSNKQIKLFDDQYVKKPAQATEVKEKPREEAPVKNRTFTFEKPERQEQEEETSNELSNHFVGLDKEYEFINKIEKDQNQ